MQSLYTALTNSDTGEKLCRRPLFNRFDYSKSFPRPFKLSLHVVRNNAAWFSLRDFVLLRATRIKIKELLAKKERVITDYFGNFFDSIEKIQIIRGILRKKYGPDDGEGVRSSDSSFSHSLFTFRWHGTNSLEHDSCPSSPAAEFDANGDITSAIISAATGRDASIHPNVRSIGSRHSRGSASYPYVAR